jgi:type IV secretory pathway VirB3-like protein
MEVRVVDRADICQGAIRPRTLLGVPTSLMIGGIVLTGIMVYLTSSWWILPPALAVYGWLKWQTKKDPLWLQTWWRHLQHRPVYEG